MKPFVRSIPVRLRRRGAIAGTSSAADVAGDAADERSPAQRDASSPFDDGRDLSDKAFYSACYAPHTSMFFNQLGDVRACCHNLQYSLGNVRTDSIRDIWDGAAAEVLRTSLESRDFSHGCTHCAWQAENGANDIRFSRVYDGRPVDEQRPAWPTQMEFALTNACNLQCVMCTGWNSSAIRAHREKLPPIEVPYGDEFFEQLAEFLPHLDRVTVLGGEPFLGAESLRLFEMVAALDRVPDIWVTTNGTQWTPRVQRLLERVPMDLEFSLDGVTKETFERIRIGADFDRVVTNLRRYRDAARAHGRKIGLSYCLMTANGHEFGELLRFAEDEGMDFVKVNLVTYPLDNSYYRLSAEDLAIAIADLEQAGSAHAASLTRFRSVWDEQLAALRHRLEHADDEGDGPGAGAVPRTAPWEGMAARSTERALEVLRSWAPGIEPTFIRGDESMTIVELDGPLAAQAGVGEDALIGRPLPGMLSGIEQATNTTLVPSQTDQSSSIDNEVSFAGVRDGETVCELRTFLFRDGTELIALATLQHVGER